MPSVVAPDLSENDSLVLSALFDPEASLNNASAGDVVPTETNKNTRSDTDSDILQQEREAIRLMNTPQPSRAQIELALQKLTHVCDNAPSYASGWCNRAQATRLLLSMESPAYSTGDQSRDIVQTTRENRDLLQRNLSDLGRAIELASPVAVGSPSTTPTPSMAQASVLSAAHTHRAYILWLFSRTDSEFDADSLPAPLTGLSKEALEEMASREFALGGRYGHQIAKQVSVKTNPYAKLCGNIVKEAMRKEIAEHYAGYDYSAQEFRP